jgi:hypothetical protein
MHPYLLAKIQGQAVSSFRLGIRSDVFVFLVLLSLLSKRNSTVADRDGDAPPIVFPQSIDHQVLWDSQHVWTDKHRGGHQRCDAYVDAGVILKVSVQQDKNTKLTNSYEITFRDTVP